jgi:hypothetical protein
MPIETVVGKGNMKTQFLKLVKTVVAPIALVLGMAAFTPVAALAQGHGGHGGYAGHSFAAPRNFGGGRGFTERGYGGGVRGGFYAGRPSYGGGYDGRGYYGGRGYWAPGFSVGVYPYGYGYVAPTCNPSGFYDQYGNWQPYQGCGVPPAY